MLEWATSYFSTRDIESPRLLIEYAIAEVLDIKRLDLYLQFDRPLSQQELDKLRPIVKNLGNGEPLQYVLGYQDFYNLRVKVDKRALIPRPETEELVDWICSDLSTLNSSETLGKIWDIGTGSGCIPLALKKAFPDIEVLSSDISNEALALAKENADELKLALNLFEHDFSKKLKTTAPKQIDLIVSNPPYIHPNEVETVDKHVHNWEPHTALYVEDVLYVYQCLVNQAKDHLKENGFIYLELNPLHASEIEQLFTRQIGAAEIKKDIAGKERFLKVIRHF
jgi:release factor glutamine methyltransferase